MKTTLTLVLAFFASASIACTDFSGAYTEEQTQTPITIEQSACENITVKAQDSSVTIITDGQLRVDGEDKFTVISSSATFVGANLVVEGIIEYKLGIPPMPADSVPGNFYIAFEKDVNGNIVETTTLYSITDEVIESNARTYLKNKKRSFGSFFVCHL